MTRRISVALVAGLMLAIGLASTVAAGGGCPAESTTDLWDVSQGATIDTSSGFGGGTDNNMFGATDPSAEAGVSFFRDDQAAGFVHFVEWSTPQTVQVDSIHLRAAHDGDNPQRAFSQVTIYGWNAGTSTFDQLFTLDTSAYPYGDGTFNGGPDLNLLDRCPTVPTMVTDRFRAEFVQTVTSSFPGPRLIELDALGSVVVAPTPAPAASVPDAAMTVPTSSGNAAATLGALLVLAGALGTLLVFSRRPR